MSMWITKPKVVKCNTQWWPTLDMSYIKSFPLKSRCPHQEDLKRVKTSDDNLKNWAMIGDQINEDQTIDSRCWFVDSFGGYPNSLSLVTFCRTCWGQAEVDDHPRGQGFQFISTFGSGSGFGSDFASELDLTLDWARRLLLQQAFGIYRFKPCDHLVYVLLDDIHLSKNFLWNLVNWKIVH